MVGLDKFDVMGKQEIDFMKFIIRPLWKVYNEYCGGAMGEAISNIETNIKEWEILIEGEKEKKKKENEEKLVEDFKQTIYK